MNLLKKESQAILLRIFMGESDKFEGKQFYVHLVGLLHKNHFAGVTVLRGITGFGQKSLIHSANILDLSTDLPIVIEVVDTEEKISSLKEMLNRMEIQKHLSMLITEEKVRIIQYGKEQV